MKVCSIHVLGDYVFWLVCLFRAMKVCSICVSVTVVLWLLCLFRDMKVCSIYVLGDYGVLVTLLIQSYEGSFDLCPR